MASKWDNILRSRSSIEKGSKGLLRRLEAQNSYMGRRMAKQHYQLATAVDAQSSLQVRMTYLERLHTFCILWIILETVMVLRSKDDIFSDLKTMSEYGEQKAEWLGTLAQEAFTMAKRMLTTSIS